MKRIALLICLFVIFLSGCTDIDATKIPNTSSNRIPSVTPSVSYNYNGWLFFADDTEPSIRRVNENGEDLSVIFEYKHLMAYDEESITYLYVADNLLIFKINVRLYSYNMKTTKLTEIHPYVIALDVVNDELYFCGKDFSIYKMSFNDEKGTVLLESEGDKNIYKNFVFVGDTMYYYKRNPNGLFCYENGQSTLIDDNMNINEYSLFEYNGRLYYVVFREDDALFEYNPESKERSKMLSLSNYSSGGEIINGYFHYLDTDGNLQKIMIP